MKHIHPDKLIICYNICRVGGSRIIYSIDTSLPLAYKEQEQFVDDFKAHGFDVLTPEDFQFAERVGEYNEVSMRSARINEMSCYDEYSFEKLCVCGDWMFTTDYYCHTESKELPKRGGKRAGAGAKSKHNLMGGTAVIRVPGYQKKQIKEFVDFLIETEQSDGVSLGLAISMGISALKGKKSVWEEQGLQDLAAHEQKYIECLQQLYYKLPRGFVSKTSEEEKRGSVL